MIFFTFGKLTFLVPFRFFALSTLKYVKKMHTDYEVSMILNTHYKKKVHHDVI
jgi:hypothetical protein